MLSARWQVIRELYKLPIQSALFRLKPPEAEDFENRTEKALFVPG